MQAMKEIALVHDALGNYVQAQPMLVELLKQRSHEFGERHDEVIDTQIDLSKVYRRIGKLEQAENECSKSLSILNDQNRSDTDSLLLKCMSELAMIYLAGRNSPKESLARTLYQNPESIRGSRCLEFTSRANSRRSPEEGRQAKRSRGALDRSGRGVGENPRRKSSRYPRSVRLLARILTSRVNSKRP